MADFALRWSNNYQLPAPLVAVAFVDADEGYILIRGGHPLEGETDDGRCVVAHTVFQQCQFPFP